MSRITPNEIRERTRQEVAKRYTKKIDDLKVQMAKLESIIFNLRESYAILKQENDELKEKARQSEEWIERLQDFCNMSDEERNNIVEQWKAEKIRNEKLNGLFTIYQRYLDVLDL